MIHYADPHFPVLCSDVPNAGCCDCCHEEDRDLPLALYLNGSEVIDYGMDVPSGALALGYSCCSAFSMTRAAVFEVVARHVIGSVEGCRQCELSRTLK